MRQFFAGDRSAFDKLEEHARRACVRFRRQEMPPGCDPPEADIGFEVDEVTGTARLLVARNVSYRGTDHSVREWLDAGAVSFPSFSALTEWVLGPLREEFLRNKASNRSPGPEDRVEVTGLTDVAAGHEGLRTIQRPLYVDEQQLYVRLRRRVLGQDRALKALAGVLVRHCARVRPTRPAAVFIVGPPGVGKTHTAEVTAQVLRELDNNNSYQFLRLDMSEHKEEHRVSQMLGTVQANPRTIVLFEEIEKAHSVILEYLVNALDAGRLSAASGSSGGREIDCRQAVFMFTSNLDTKEFMDELESHDDFGNRSVEEDVCRRRLLAAGVAPEFVGRIGRFLVYRSQSAETRAEKVARAVAEVAQEYGVEVGGVDPKVVTHLVERVRSEGFAARPERFLVDDELGDVFAGVARRGLWGPVQVMGPPFTCSSIVEAHDQSQRNDKGADSIEAAEGDRS